MRNLILIVLMIIGANLTTEAQEIVPVQPKYFAQCMLSIEDETAFRTLEENLRANPNVSIVRLDWYSKRAFLLTKELTAFSQSDFTAWLGEYADDASCIQVGVHGVDQVNPYPFTNCDNN